MDPIPPDAGGDERAQPSPAADAARADRAGHAARQAGLARRRAIVAIVLAGMAGLAWFDARNSGDALRADMTKRLADEDAALAQAKARDSDQTGELREAHAKLALLETRMAELQSQQASLEALYHDIAPSRDEILLDRSGADAAARDASNCRWPPTCPAALAALQLADGRLAGTNRAQFTAAAPRARQGHGTAARRPCASTSPALR